MFLSVSHNFQVSFFPKTMTHKPELLKQSSSIDTELSVVLHWDETITEASQKEAFLLLLYLWTISFYSKMTLLHFHYMLIPKTFYLSLHRAAATALSTSCLLPLVGAQTQIIRLHLRCRVAGSYSNRTACCVSVFFGFVASQHHRLPRLASMPLITLLRA